jgi:hypothetical protein
VSWAAFCAAALLVGRGTADAYALEGAKWYQSTLEMQLQFPAPESVLLDGSVDFYKSFENAEALWNEQLAGFQLTWSELPNGSPKADRNGITNVSMQTSVYGKSFGSGTIAVTLLNFSGAASTSHPAQMTETDIVFNIAKFTFNSYRGPTQGATDLHRIALHELGHVLGLDHPDQSHPEVGYVKPSRPPVAIMSANESDIDSLQADDVAGAQSLYGAAANAPARVGNGRLANISTRVQVGTGERVMIGGFVIQNASKPVLIRALGPSLPVTGTLADPVLELHGANGELMATNNNWQDDPAQAQNISRTGVAPSDKLESAIYAELASGSYTAIVRGKNSSSGIGLVEVYDLAPSSGRIANISTRGEVSTGDNVIIGGFIINGPQSVKVVVRAIGPSLQGITAPLADPMLELRNSNGDLIISNDNAGYNESVADQLRNLGLYPTNENEAAILTGLAPGNFTAIVRGKNEASGVGLVEVYDVD